MNEQEVEDLFVKTCTEAQAVTEKQRLERIATAAMQGILANDDKHQRALDECSFQEVPVRVLLAREAVSNARALIAELDKEERKRVTINASGFSDSDLFTGSQIREMFDRINEELDREIET